MSTTEEVSKESEELESQQEYYRTSLRDGYRGLIGALLGTTVSEAFLLLGRVGGDAPLLFGLIGLVFSARHIAQIWQAKQQLKERHDSLIE